MHTLLHWMTASNIYPWPHTRSCVCSLWTISNNLSESGEFIVPGHIKNGKKTKTKKQRISSLVYEHRSSEAVIWFFSSHYFYKDIHTYFHTWVYVLIETHWNSITWVWKTRFCVNGGDKLLHEKMKYIHELHRSNTLYDFSAAYVRTPFLCITLCQKQEIFQHVLVIELSCVPFKFSLRVRRGE